MRDLGEAAASRARVTYKTAWGMFKQIRTLLSDDDGEPIGGSGVTVEADETYIGPKKKRGTKCGRPGPSDPKTPVFGMVERGGRVVARVVPTVRVETIVPEITHRVLPYTTIYTDEYQIYNPLKSRGYWHQRIHHIASIYVNRRRSHQHDRGVLCSRKERNPRHLSLGQP